MSVVVAYAAFMSTLVFSPLAAHDGIAPAKPGTEPFEQFRPVYHFLARDNWINDPCGPYYDEETDLYHLFYQYNPNSTVWGNATWGHAVSKDQVTWEDYPNALRPFEDKWDHLGVFSGSAMGNAIDGKRTVFYTGVTALPIHWTKTDNGKTWQKGSEPLIELPPKGLNVTGWRDPNVFHSKSLDTYFGFDATNGSNYLLVAGGIHDVGPRFLLAEEKNTTFSLYSASWGFNFATTVYREIQDEDGEVHNVMRFAAEGDPNRYPMWATGSFSGGGCGVEVDPEAGLFTPLMVGVSDRSDCAREVGITIVRDIYDVDEHLVGKGDWIVSDSKDVSCADGSTKQSKTIKTLGVKPLSDLQLLRNVDALEQVASVSVNGSSQVLNSTGASFELIAEVSDFERGSKVGFEVRRSSAGDEVTTIFYDDAEKKVTIDRSKSSTAECAVFTDNGVKPISDSVWGYLYQI
ncbi:hypothetical protein PInf_018855 [Phytophthora infestans]|nr:hypothetical protein PInf_018855 [Phytophthora infestans]